MSANCEALGKCLALHGSGVSTHAVMMIWRPGQGNFFYDIAVFGVIKSYD